MPVVNIPFVNKNTAYRFKPTINENKLPELNLPIDWESKALQAFPGLGKHFYGGGSIVYDSRDHLKRSFSFFYAVLTDRVKIEGVEIDLALKQTIKEKIAEQIEACSQGFHNRINSLYGLFFVPKTIADLLQRVRQSLIINAVSKATQCVHGQNGILEKANEWGYGVECANKKDKYGSSGYYLAETTVPNSFKERFTWVHILAGLKEEIKGVLISAYGYRGGLSGDDHYDKGEYDAFIKYVNELFHKDFSEQALFLFDDDYNVIDINWRLISTKLWDAVKKELFTFPASLFNSLEALFHLETFDENQQRSIKNDLAKIRPFIHNKKEFQSLISLFPEIDKRLIIDEFFDSRSSWRDTVMSDFEYFMKNNELDSQLKNYAISKFKEIYIYQYREIHQSFSSKYGSHCLLTAYESAQKNVTDLIFKLNLLTLDDRLGILNCQLGNGKTLLESLLTHHYVLSSWVTEKEKNNKNAFIQKKPSFFKLLDGFNSNQLDRFFQSTNYLALALEHHRASLLPLLMQLEKCNENIIALALLSSWGKGKNQTVFLALLNGDQALTKELTKKDNKPLNEEGIQEVQKLAITLLKKLPVDFQCNFIPCNEEDNFLMAYASLGLSRDVGKELFEQMDEALLSDLLKSLPSKFEAKHLPGVITLIEVVPASASLTLLDKKITYSERWWKLNHTHELAKKLFFDKEGLLVLVNAFQKFAPEQKQHLIDTIFTKKDNSELSKFLEKVGEAGTYKEFSIFSSMLPKNVQFQQVANALAERKENWTKIIPFLKDFSKEEIIALFGNKKLKKTLNDTSDYHQELVLYLKNIELDDERHWIIDQLFSHNPTFFSKMLLNEASYSLLKLFPSALLLSMFDHAIVHDLITKDRYAKCVDFLPLLKKGNKLKDLELKSRRERDLEKKQLLKQQIESEIQIDNARNLIDARKLSQILLKPTSNQKTVFQNILENMPSKAFQLLLWSDFFEKENILQSYVEQACGRVFEFNFENVTSSQDLFDDLLKIVKRAPHNFLLKNLSAISPFVSNSQSMQSFLDVVKKMNGPSIKLLFEKKRGVRQSEQTLLELLGDTENAFSMVETAFGFIKKMKAEKNIDFSNILDLNVCSKFYSWDLEQQVKVFQSIWNDGFCDREKMLAFLKSIEVERFVKLKFQLLNFVVKDLALRDLGALILYGAENNTSLLREAVMCHENMDEFDWQQVLRQVPDHVIFGLLDFESYTEQKDSLLDYLLQKKQYPSFFKIYEFVSECKASEFKEKFLGRAIPLPRDVNLMDILSISELHPGCVAYFISSDVKELFDKVQNIDFKVQGNANIIAGFFQKLLKTDEGIKCFRDLLIYTKWEGEETIFHKLVTSRNHNLFNLAFCEFDALELNQKLKLAKFCNNTTLYQEVVKRYNPSIFSLNEDYTAEQKRMVTKHLSLLPCEHWRGLALYHAFFFDEYHIGKETLISPYLFTLKSYELNSLLERQFDTRDTFLKVLDELDSGKCSSKADFIRLLIEHASAPNIDQMLRFTLHSGRSFSAKFLSDEPGELSLFLQCLGELSDASQRHLLSNLIYELKGMACEPTLIAHLELKRELLNLQKARDDINSQLPSTSRQRKKALVGLLYKFTEELNDAYALAIRADTSMEQKQQSLKAVKELINDPETRDLINTHRGVKKILVNILLAFAGLGVGYLLGCSVNYYWTQGKHFFYHPPTRTESIVSDIAQRVEKIDISVRQ